MLGNRRRAMIVGSAGSGKTLLAIEKARLLAEDGSRILFTCFNRNLASAIRERLNGTGVEGATFHELCYRLGRQAGADLPDELVADMPAAYVNEKLPAALELAVSKLGPCYDGMIADEGQNFQDTWWLSLMDLLRNPARAAMYVFFDDRQDLYGRDRAWPIDDVPFELSINCRSTLSIHHHLQAMLPGKLDGTGHGLGPSQGTQSEPHGVAGFGIGAPGACVPAWTARHSLVWGSVRSFNT